MENQAGPIDDLLSGKIEVKTCSFEQGLKLLEKLVQSVESGALPLDRAVTSYEKGVELLEHLRGHLGAAEERLRVLQKSAE